MRKLLLAAACLAFAAPLAAQAPATGPRAAPVTTADRAKLPPEAAQALAAYDRISAAMVGGFEGVPQLGIRAADDDVTSRTKGCQPGKHLMMATWAPGGKLAYYYGEAVNCVPEGVGLIGFNNGAIWLGEVADYGILRDPSKRGKKRDNIFPVRMGLGIERTAAQLKAGGGIAARFVLKNAAPLTSCSGCAAIIVAGYAAVLDDLTPLGTAIAYFPVSGPAYIAGVDYLGNSTPENIGRATAHFPGGTVFTGNFAGGQPKPGNYVTRTSPDGTTVKAHFKGWTPQRGVSATITRSNGDSGTGLEVRFKDNDPTGVARFVGRAEERLANADPVLGLPRGQYVIAHRTTGGVTTRTFVAPIGDTLFNGGPQRDGCKLPTFLPEGFTTFWPACRPEGKTAADGKPLPARTDSFSRDLGQRLMELFGDVGYRFGWRWTDANGAETRYLAANGFVMEPVFGPVGKAMLRTRDGAFEGEFVGMVPDGPGSCYVAAEDVTEPCFYAQGARTDEIHLARQEAKIAARAAKREAEAIAAENARIEQARQQAESRRREAQQAADYAAAEAQRAARRAEIDAENDEIDAANAAQGNPILNALNDLNGQFRNAAAESQRGWDRVNAINAAQQRAADARAAARQAENARIAQSNAAAAEARAAQSRSAQAATAAEIQRRQADAQQRVAEARQRAIAQQQAQAQTTQAAQSPARMMTASAPSPAPDPTAPARGNRAAAAATPTRGFCQTSAGMDDLRRLWFAINAKARVHDACEHDNYIMQKKSRADTARICAPQQAEVDRAREAHRAHPCYIKEGSQPSSATAR